MSAKAAVEEVFTKPLADLIWTANTLTIYPVTLQNFSVGSLLPAVFYMFRRGHRRGKGRFLEEFSPDPKTRPNIFFVALRLSQEANAFEGFESTVARDILGDLLLCDALENKGHSEGHGTEVHRAFPVHFFTSWLDLPQSVAHLRFVPEMLVALLANQSSGRFVTPNANGDFSVGCAPEQNLLLRIFGRGVEFGENIAQLDGDRASEDVEYPVEELLTLRLAQCCGGAPEKLRALRGGTADIFNLLPIAQIASDSFRADLSALLRHFGQSIPRRAFTPMTEAIIALGLWHSFLASLAIALQWEQTGAIPAPASQKPVLSFVDASNGIDTRLRDLSEQSQEETLRLLDEATTALTMIRILDAKGRFDRKLRDAQPSGPDVVDWLNQLGAVRFDRHERADSILNDLSEKLHALAERLEQESLGAEAIDILRADGASRDPARALAEAISSLMGDKLLRSQYLKFLDSTLMVNEPHGLARKRRVSRIMAGGKRKMMDARSIVLSNTLLDTLVHLHLVGREGRFSFHDFLQLLRERYGLCVDEAPPGIAAGREDLLRNRAILERRLRDLGLLVGVNDAESMKHLRAHYRFSEPA